MPFSKYAKLPGSERQPMQGATESGSLDPKELMQVTVVLRPRAGEHTQQLNEMIAQGKRVSREEYTARYGADPADVQAVLAFAGHFGLAMSNLNLGARSVTLSGTCADFANAFQVKLARYHYRGGSYRGRTGAVNIPHELSGIVVAV